MIPLPRILTDHLTRYPLMQVQDVYKLLHQAALGSGHFVRYEESARKTLERELAEIGDGPDEPLLDPISPDGSIARLHLRPCIRAGKDPQALLTAFIRTANEWRGSAQTLRAYGQTAAQQAEMAHWRINRREIETFFAAQEAKDFPAVHHSGIYTGHYHPAYRVVKTDLWRQVESIQFSP